MSLGWSDAVALYSAGTASRSDRSRGEGKLRAELLAKLSAVADSVVNNYTSRSVASASTSTSDAIAATKALSANIAPQHPLVISMAIDEVMNKAFRASILQSGIRSDGRTASELRPLSIVAPALPSVVHGSSFFGRGDTHVLTTTTLGMSTFYELFFLKNNYLLIECELLF
jgi:polyribonucleotide nucleotidyltransferase